MRHPRLLDTLSFGLVGMTLLLPSGAGAQGTFFKTIGAASYSEAYAITNSGDGGYVLAGRVGANFNDDIYVVRTDALGDTVWARRLAGPGAEYGFSVCQAGDGGFVVAGFGSGIGAGENDVVLVKFSATGSVVWSRTIGGPRNEEAYRVQRTPDGGFLIAGHSNESTSTRFLLIKTDAAGATSWVRTYGGDAGDRAFGLCQTSDGGYALTGRTASYGGGTTEIFVVKTDGAGTLTWARAYGGASTDESYDILPMADGGVLVGGRTFSSGAGFSDVLLVRTDAAGAIVWNRTLGGAGAEDRTSLVSTAGGGYLLSATTGSFGTGNDLWLVATDGTGNPTWSRAFGGTSIESAYALALATDGGIAIAGTSNSFGPGLSANLALLKTDGAGGGTCFDQATTAVAGTPVLNVTVASPTVRSPTFTNASVSFTVTSIGDSYVVCSMTSGVGEGRPPTPNWLTLAPNPASDRVTLHWTGPAIDGPTTVSLFDAAGRLVWTRRSALGFDAARPERIDLAGVPPGVYFVSVASGSVRATGKLIRR